MKIFNDSKIHKRTIACFEILIHIIHAIICFLKHIFSACSEPCIVLVDGFLIGDAVLLRPLIKSLIHKYSSTHKIIVISGCHSREIYSDLNDSIQLIEYQFPWAVYDYSFQRITNLIRIWCKLYLMSIDIAIEARGDVRSISWMYLTCPVRLVGFDFTGGRSLLTDIVPDDGKIVHLFEHVQRIGRSVGCSVSDVDIKHAWSNSEHRIGKRIGLSFSGSQILRNLPEDIGCHIINTLISDSDCEIWYIQSPAEKVFTTNYLTQKFGSHVHVFTGNFKEYFDFIKSLSLYIGMDSGGGHLCSLWEVPAVIIFGTQLSYYTMPVGNPSLYCAESETCLPCRPCRGVNCRNDVYQKCLIDIDFTKIIKSSIMNNKLTQ